MRSTLLNGDAGNRTFAVIMETGDEAMSCLQTFIEKERISAAQFTAIGALSDARLEYFDWERKEYLPIPVTEQVEVASLIGDVALSPEGKRLAWVIAEPGRYDLWISNLEKMAPVKIVSSGEEIVTPRFADETLLLYITGSTLMLVSSEKPKRSQAVWLPFRSVTRIDRAQRNRDHIECIVSAEHPDTPAFNFPYLASISVSDGGTAVFRLPVNPFYQSYSLLEEGAPFFFAGSEEGVEGIHYFQLDAPDGRVNTLWRGHSPGLVALAANGSRLVFAGNP